MHKKGRFQLHIYLTNFLINYGIISEDEKDEYQYGIEVLLLKCLHLLTILIISITLGFVLESIVFLSVYNNVRGIIGGYHAKTRIVCLIYTILIVLVLYLILLFARFSTYMILVLIFELIVSITIFVLNKNMKYKNKLKLSLMILLILSCLFYLFSYYTFVLATTYALFLSLFLCITKR